MGQLHEPQDIFRRVDLSSSSSLAWLGALRQSPWRTGTSAGDLLESLVFDEAPTPVELVRRSVAELRFGDCASLQDIYERAVRGGLKLCPALVGPRLRLDYVDQPKGDWLFMAMRQLPDGDGSPSIFSLDSDVHGRWLRAFTAQPTTRFHPADIFVFAR